MNTIMSHFKSKWLKNRFKYKKEYVDLPDGGRVSINWADNS